MVDSEEFFQSLPCITPLMVLDKGELWTPSKVGSASNLYIFLLFLLFPYLKKKVFFLLLTAGLILHLLPLVCSSGFFSTHHSRSLVSICFWTSVTTNTFFSSYSISHLLLLFSSLL